MNIIKQKANDNNLDIYLTLYEIYLNTIKNSCLKANNENLSLGYDKVIYNKGVKDFLKYLMENNIDNYLLSSGILVYLEKIDIAPLFQEIFGTSFYYNDKKEAIGVDYLMSDKNKVEAIKKINLNRKKAENDCNDVIYIGDGLTDTYAMEYVHKNGGSSIFVYQDVNNKDIINMKKKEIVDYFAYADFSSDSDLTQYILHLCGINNK